MTFPSSRDYYPIWNFDFPIGYNVALPKRGKIKEFDADLIEDFFQALVTTGGITLHINLRYGRNIHHIFEAVFKAFARALDEATSIDSRVSGIPSTKGRL